MSIKINGKTIAGLCIPNSASETEEGVIRIATDEEAKAGELTNVAVTPKQLAENGGTEVDTSNLVTLDGEQTITGTKTFGSDIQLGSNSLSFSDGALTLNPQGSSNLNITTMGGALDVTGNLTLTGNIKAYQNQAKPIELRSDGSTMSMVYGDNTLNMSDDSLTYTNASGETKDLLAGGGSSDNVVTLDTNQTITGQKIFTQQVQCSPVNSYKDMWLGQSGPGAYGLVFQSNNSPYEFTIYNQGYTASSLKVAGFEGGVKFANTVNFNSSIYDKDGNEIVGGNSGGGSSGESEFTYGTTDWDYYSGSFGWLHHEPSGIIIQGGQLPYFSGNLEAVAVVNFEKPYKTLCSIIVFDAFDKTLFSTIQLWDDIDEEGNQGILGFELEEQPHMDTYWIAFGY